MVNIKTTGKEQSLARLLKQGRVLPVISGEALDNLSLSQFLAGLSSEDGEQ